MGWYAIASLDHLADPSSATRSFTSFSAPVRHGHRRALPYVLVRWYRWYGDQHRAWYLGIPPILYACIALYRTAGIVCIACIRARRLCTHGHIRVFHVASQFNWYVLICYMPIWAYSPHYGAILVYHVSGHAPMARPIVFSAFRPCGLSRCLWRRPVSRACTSPCFPALPSSTDKFRYGIGKHGVRFFGLGSS